MRSRWLLAAAVLGVAVAVAALAWFEPHKLFIDDRVDEPAPTRNDAPTANRDSAPTVTAAPAANPGPIDIAGGSFVSRDHGTSGRVRILDLGDGTQIVRLEGLETSNGPDLYLYLSTTPAAGEEAGFDDDIVNLGRLTGNLGDQNYPLPTGTDLSRYHSVVIWCDRFDSAFGAADLTPAS